MKKIATILSLLLICFSCVKKNEEITQTSFYYWKSNFNISSSENEILKETNCSKIYVKYFDVVFEEEQVKPVSVILFKTETNLAVIPVIYIKNNVFKLLDSTGVDSLVFDVYSLISKINSVNKISPKEIQFDCDWTDITKTNYFQFLRKYRKISGQVISSTIRLHQVKYKNRTGVPPVDKGVLMYYNMGSVNAGHVNSIYDRSNAIKYVSWLKSYPLNLDIALPVFSWGIQLRNNTVVNLLNKTGEQDFLGDTNFIPGAKGVLIAKNSCFKSGYYYSQNDCIKFEKILPEQLFEISEDLKENMGKKPAEIIFYDLDEINIKQYDKTIYKKVADSFN